MRIVGLLLFAASLSQVASADTVAIVNDNTTSTFGHNNFDLAGWNFSNSANLTVTQLGMFANGGLQDQHFVGIYDTSGNLQTSLTIPTGLTPDAQGYVYTTLTTPFQLSAGNWFIGAYYNQGSADKMRDTGGSGGGPVTTAAEISFTGAKVYYSGSAFDPTTPNLGTATFSQDGRASYFGPNFQYVLDSRTATPEPASYGLMAGGLLALGFARRRKTAARA